MVYTLYILEWADSTSDSCNNSCNVTGHVKAIQELSYGISTDKLKSKSDEFIDKVYEVLDGTEAESIFCGCSFHTCK